jgi:hypothetical protein
LIILHAVIDLHELKPRLQIAVLAQVLNHYPVVVLQGARQTGKTILTQVPPIGRDRSFLTLDEVLSNRVLALPVQQLLLS